MISNYSQRIRIVIYAVLSVSLLIVGKLFWMQIVKADYYEKKSENQYSKAVSKTFDRGSIFFESKDNIKIGAATVKEGYTLAINPKLITDENAVYSALSDYVKIDKEIFLSKASQKSDPYEEIIKKVEKDIGESIIALRIPGVIVSKDIWRVYPGDSLASQTIGIVGFDNENNLSGRYGLERYYEDTLSHDAEGVKTNVFAEIFADIKNTVFSDDGTREGDIVTSIEPTVQSSLEKTLVEIEQKWKSDSIGAIIMDPKTGEIFALANWPTFNPNNMKNIKDPKIFSNPLVEDLREMGSIIKPLTMATGIDTGSIESEDTYNDTGFMELNSKKISNFDKKARGITTMQDVLSKSLNIGAAHIALKTGRENFTSYFKSLGLGEKTGIDLPSEQKGLIKNLDNNRDIEIATASYGQGIAISPMETIRALATLANGGMLVTPHLVKHIEYSDGSIEAPQYSENRIFKKETTDEVTRMLVNLVDKELKNGEVKMQHYSIAAKTGTAQIADPANRGYYSDRYLHSFFGYFPAYNPRFIVFIYHINPKNAEFASETLTDPFMQIAKFLINYYELPPDR